MKKRNVCRIALIALALVAVVLGTPSPARCDSFSITLISNSSTQYFYGVTVPADTSVTFDFGQTITLTGLSGVTGASLGGVFAFGGVGFEVESFTSDSVTFIQNGFSSTTFPNSASVPDTFHDLIIDSTAPPGTVDWSGQTSVGNFSGTVAGPVAASEPSTLSILLASVAGVCLLAFFRRE